MFLRRLHLDSDVDRRIASELFLSNPGFELQHHGRLPTQGMAEPLWQRFPEECTPEHRLTFVAFKNVQHQHIGCEIVERLSKQARRWPDISSWYVTVMDSNAHALAFWRHCGFRTKTQGLVCNGFAQTVTLLTRPVKARPACKHSRAPESASQLQGVKLFARLP